MKLPGCINFAENSTNRIEPLLLESGDDRSGFLDYAEDGISISFPDLPGCLSCAISDQEALYMAKDVLGGYLSEMEHESEPIPNPSNLKDLPMKANQRIVLVEVLMPMYREAAANRAVKKTLTIPVWLNDLAEKNHVNYSVILQSALRLHLGVNQQNVGKNTDKRTARKQH